MDKQKTKLLAGGVLVSLLTIVLLYLWLPEKTSTTDSAIQSSLDKLNEQSKAAGDGAGIDGVPISERPPNERPSKGGKSE